MISKSAFDLLPRLDLAAIASVGDEGPYTVENLLRGAQAVSATLPSQGANDRVLCTCTDRHAFAAVALAVWSRGACLVLPPNLRPGTLEELAADPSCTATISDERAEQLLANAAHHEPLALASLAPEQILAAVHTSGTTAGARGITKRASQLLAEADALIEAFGLAQAGPLLATVPPHHIYGLLFGVLAPLRAAVPMVRATPLHGATVAATVHAHRVTTLVSTPAHLRGLTVLEPSELSGLDRVFSSGAALHPETARVLRERFSLGVTEVLGSTETGGIAYRVTDGGADGSWTPLPTVQVSADSDGRILVSSPFVDPGEPQPRPGDDRIEQNADGTFFHHGRLDDVVKVGGKRLSLGELERRLLALPGVRDAAVMSEDLPGGRGVRVRAAAVAPKDAGPRLRAALLQHFDNTVVPRTIKVVGALPREATGKLPRARLASVFSETGEVMEVEVHSRTDTEENCREVRVKIPGDLVYFRGHFPGFPVLPGVAQLDLIVVREIVERWPELCAPSRIARLKFKATIAPLDELLLTLTRKGHKVSFTLRRGDEPCATGTMIYAEPAAP